MSKTKILILDGENRSSLAALRSLGSNAKYNCYIASSDTNAICFSSKYSLGNLIAPNKKCSDEEFNSWLKDTVNKLKVDYILPTSEPSLLAIYKDDELRELLLNLPFPTNDQLSTLLDKYEITKILSKYGINSPKTFCLSKNEEPANLDELKKLGFPIILKPRKSVQYLGSQKIKPPLLKIRNENELELFLSSKNTKSFDYIAQEFINGEGCGFFYLIKNNKVTANFAHLRILEKPPEGGVSVLSESCEIPDHINQALEKFLLDYKWNGLIMFEFKKTQDNEYYLIEINPRLWGSIQLAIDSGVDFPNLLVSADQVSSSITKYKLGQRLRWELGTLDHALIKLKRSFWNNLISMTTKNELKFFAPKTKFEIFRSSDAGPFWSELKNYFKRIR